MGFLTSTLASLGVSHLLAASSKRLYSMWCRSFSFSRCTPAEAECLSGHVTDPEDTVLLKRRLVDPSTGAAVKGDGSSVAQREEGHTKGGARRPNGGLAEGREGRDADGMAPGGPAPISRHVRCASESPSAEDPLRAPHPRVVPVRRHEVEAAARRLAEWLAAAEGGHDEYVRVGECMGRAAAVLRKVGAGAREEMARRLWRMLFRLGVNQQGEWAPPGVSVKEREGEWALFRFGVKEAVEWALPGVSVKEREGEWGQERRQQRVSGRHCVGSVLMKVGISGRCLGSV